MNEEEAEEATSSMPRVKRLDEEQPGTVRETPSACFDLSFAHLAFDFLVDATNARFSQTYLLDENEVCFVLLRSLLMFDDLLYT